MALCSTTAAATLVDFNWNGAAGYSANGNFSYNVATTPMFFTEKPGAGATAYIQSFSVSFYDPQHNVLESGSSVVNGVSSDRFFTLAYDTQSETISSLDADIGGSSYQYFLTNLRTPDGKVVGPGVTDFNLFYRPGSTPILDSAPRVQVTSVTQSAVPEPATLQLLAVAGTVALFARTIRQLRPLRFGHRY